MNKYVVFILCLLSIVTVKASEFSLNIICPKDELSIGEKIVCDVTINSDVSITNVSFNYNTDLNISFVKEDNNINIVDRNIVAVYNTPISNANLFKIEIFGKDSGESQIVFSNIKVNNNLSIDDITKKINIKDNNVLSGNNKLSDITIDGISIENFNPNINHYENIVVTKPIVFIDIKGKDDKAMVTGVGSVMLRRGVPTNVNIQVTSEDGNINTYTLVIKYEKEVSKSHDASLESIELYNKNNRLDFSYDKDKSSFRIKVNSNVDSVLIKAIPANDKAFFIDELGPREVNLNYGDNFIELKVESENGDIKIYSINIERMDNRDSDNTLKELIINENVIKIETDIYEYSISVPFETDLTNVKAIPKSTKASVDYSNINLYEGNNKMNIKVTSENGKTKEYHINILRLSKVEEEELPDILDNSEIDIQESVEKDSESLNDSSEKFNYLIYYILIGVMTLGIVFIILFGIIRKK